jgi:adenine-specific DNA-methyltransferase
MSEMKESPAAETVADLMPETPDLRAERLATLRKLFPDLFDGEGYLVDEELRKLADPNRPAIGERYEFPWTGKSRSKREAFTPSRAALVYDPKRSVNPDKAGGNVIIEGENLEALKLLTAAYRERVKLIYIDPPYNTGKDFVYSDDYTEGRKPYWEESGTTEDGVLVDTNSESNGRYHSDWLRMMYSRLLAARYLLREDGFIVVSIDDAEVANLMRLMDDVFDESNRVATLVWDKNRKNDAKFFSVGHEYMLVYARDKLYLKESNIILRADKEGVDEVKEIFDRLRKEHNDDWAKVRKGLLAHYQTWDESDERQALARFSKVDEKGPYRDDGNINWPGGGGPDYEVLHPETGKPCKLPVSGWRYPTPERFWEMYRKGRIVFGPDETTVPSVRTNLFDSKTQALPSVMYSYAQTATNEFQKLFDGKKPFDNPKHFDDLRRLVDYLSDDGDLVLDFYAGSGTTAHGVMLSNGKREFILVQFPERISDKTRTGKRALEMGYKKVSDITIDRCRRVIDILNAEAGELLQAESLGFKVYTLETSNFPRVDFVPDPDKTEAENVEFLRAYIREKENTFLRTWDRARILDEVLLKNGFMLDYTLTPAAEFTKNRVEKAQDVHRAALICLDNSIAPETVDAFRGDRDRTFICLEAALDTTKKWNLKHHLGDRLRAI